MIEGLSQLVHVEYASSQVNGMKKGVWYCFPIIVLHCCNIYNRKGQPNVKYGIAVTRPYVGCRVALDDMCTLQGTDSRNLRHTAVANEEWARLNRRPVKMDKRDVHRENRT